MRRLPRRGQQLLFRRTARRQHAFAVAADHGEHAVEQVAQIVAEIVGIAAQQALGGEVAVLAEGHLPQLVVAQRVGGARLRAPRLPRQLGDHWLGPGRLLAARLADLLAPHRPEAVGGDLLRERQPDRH